MYQGRSHACYYRNSQRCRHNTKKSTFLFFCISYFFSPSVAPSINRPEFSSDYDLNNIIYIFIPLNKVNPFPALTTPLVANLGKTCLAKGTAKSNNAFLYNHSSY